MDDDDDDDDAGKVDFSRVRYSYCPLTRKPQRRTSHHEWTVGG
jgi:hypothetical protein